MKTAKKVLAILLAAILGVGLFTGCHKKNEIAVKIGDYKYTSGYYACALVYADTEARQKVTDDLEEKGKDTTDIDFMKQKIDGTTYEKWVKNRAIEILKETSGYRALCKEQGFKLTADNKSAAENYVNTYWDSFGYEEIFSANGCSRDTFLKFTTDSYYAQVYFDNIYGKEGKTPVTDEQLKEALANKFVVVDRIEVDTADLSDEEITAKTDLLKGYLDRLNAGESFSNIFVDYDTAEGNEARDITAGNGTDSPIDPNAEFLGDDKSAYPCDYFDELSAMAPGENKIIESGTKIILVKRLDISGESYYLTNYDDALRTAVVGDAPKEAAKEKAEKLGIKTYKSAINVFKVKNITYPENE